MRDRVNFQIIFWFALISALELDEKIDWLARVFLILRQVHEFAFALILRLFSQAKNLLLSLSLCMCDGGMNE